MKKFKINGEMLGKASRFVGAKHAWRDNLKYLRIEKSDLFGARIIACDGHRLIIYIDPASDFNGPDLNIEVYTKLKKKKHGRNARTIISPFIKSCRKLRSEVSSEKGYITIDPEEKEALINGELFKLSLNAKDYVDYKKAIKRIERFTHRKTLAAINANFFIDSRHAILNEEKLTSGSNKLHFANVKSESTDDSMFLLITSFSILITMPMRRSSGKNYEASLFSTESLLDKVNLMLSHEPKNPFSAAVKKKKLALELEENFGGIFSKFK